MRFPTEKEAYLMLKSWFIFTYNTNIDHSVINLTIRNDKKRFPHFFFRIKPIFLEKNIRVLIETDSNGILKNPIEISNQQRKAHTNSLKKRGRLYQPFLQKEQRHHA